MTMKKILLLAAVASCDSAPNRAADYAQSLEPKITCKSWGQSHDGDTDIALCRYDDVLYHCTAGLSPKPACTPIIDTNVKRREQRAAQAVPAAAPAPVVSAPPSPPLVAPVPAPLTPTPSPVPTPVTH